MTAAKRGEDNFRIADHPDRTRAGQRRWHCFPKLRDARLWNSRALRTPDAVELKRTDQAGCPLGFLIQAYCVFSVAGHAKFRPLASLGTP